MRLVGYVFVGKMTDLKSIFSGNARRCAGMQGWSSEIWITTQAKEFTILSISARGVSSGNSKAFSAREDALKSSGLGCRSLDNRSGHLRTRKLI